MKWENETTDLTVALDIGTTKVCAIAGRRNELGQIDILGYGRVAGDGVQRGVVTNIDKTVRAIRDAVERAERKLGHPIATVHVGIAGQHIASRQNHGMITRDDDMAEITQADIDELVCSMRKLPLNPGEEILHILPQDFAVDDEWGIDEPIGMCGTRLGANFHIITCQNSASKNIMRCVQKAELGVSDLTLEPIASAASVLTEGDKQDGVVLVDIGGGTTDITIFADGRIAHTCVLPFGGDVISSDVRKVFRIAPQDAEDLKMKWGNALASEALPTRYIRIANRRGEDHTEISELELAEVIQARMEEILRYVDFQIGASDTRDRLQGGIVLTGGGSLLRNIDKLTEFYTGIPTRVGLPVEHLAQGYDADLGSPIFATSIGLLIGGIEREQRRREREAELELPAPVPTGAEATGGAIAAAPSQGRVVDPAAAPAGGPAPSPNAGDPAAPQPPAQAGLTVAGTPAEGWLTRTLSPLVAGLRTWFDTDEDQDLE